MAAMTISERFRGKVDKHGPIVVSKLGRCWVWTGSRGTGRYGQFRLSNPRRLVYAHRFAYELAVGAIQGDLEVVHACRNHACVNPGHLEQVDTTTRVLRGEAPSAQQARQEACRNGHPLVGKNVYTRPSSPNRRECRVQTRMPAGSQGSDAPRRPLT